VLTSLGLLSAFGLSARSSSATDKEMSRGV
jgi:hypothetical protein